MAEGFLELIPTEQARQMLERFATIGRTERVGLREAAGRVTAEAVGAPEDLPPFDRSLMDGYAVRASDVASARETSSVFLTPVGEVSMGEPATARVSPGQTVAVPTGAMLPAGADAVVMVEHTRALPDGRIEITRPAAVGQHVLRRGEDVEHGATLLPAGRRLTPLDLGACLACGVGDIPVVCRPRVAILSTGDELVAPADSPRPGQVRDTNATTLDAQVRQAGGEPWFAGRVVDDVDPLRQSTARAREGADLVLISGGSSVGMRDHTAQVLRQLAGADLLIQGIAIAPGKPTLLADIGGVATFGMPGHPVSSFVIFHVMVAPLLRRLAGQVEPVWPKKSRGRLTANAPGAPGRETWMRVRLERAADDLRVTPVPGTSAVYRSLLASDGLLRVPADQEGWAAGDEVEVEVLR